jgi:DNA-binding CsgD family transcriptional regulator
LLTAHNINGFLLLDQRRCVSDLNPELFSLLQIIGKEVGTLLQTRGIFPCALGNLNSDTALSPRELQVLQGLAYGYSIQEIADLLSISNLTVRDYCSSLIKKLGAQDRSHAVAIGLRKGLIF